MGRKPEESADLIPLNVIRSETALSRYPLHKLSKGGEDFGIDIRRSNEFGDVNLKWEVSYNSKYGQPGPLAYKLDTLLINRRIEEAEKPLPKVIRLGSLREIAEELGLGGDTNVIKKALHQNASSYITASIRYTTKEGKQRSIEFGMNRYSVVFTGETFSNGGKADAVYVELHDRFREILNSARTRPLDYDYLRGLPPTAHRLYELLSFQMYAALKNGRPRARYLYSSFCTYAPQTRYLDYERMKKQMWKVHEPHRKSGYILKAEFEETTDEDGRRDWFMCYTPGPKAEAEYRAFVQKNESLPDPPPEERPPEGRAAGAARAKTGAPPQVTAEGGTLAARLTELGVAEAAARKLVAKDPDEVRRQLDAFPHRTRGQIEDIAAWLIAAIRGKYRLPAKVVHAEEKKQARREEQRKAALDEARQRHEERHRAAFSEYLARRVGEIREGHPVAYSAFEEAYADERKKTFRVFSPDSVIGRMVFESWVCEYFRDHPACPVLDFWRWDERHNPHPFRPPESDKSRHGS
jgi:hypothetical protein